MLKDFYRKKGQGVSAEYVILIALVSVSIVAMTVYVRRTLQARYRDANRAVYMKASGVLNQEVQMEYEPYYVNTTTDTDSSSAVQERIVAGGRTNRTDALDRNSETFSTQLPF
jgi:Flp pilus assembly pilin Flp